MVEIKNSIIEYQNKIMNFIKSNKKASDLNLKFLDLKFKTVLPLSFHQNTPLSQENYQNISHSETNTMIHFSNKNKVAFSKSIQLTNDVSQDNTLLTDDIEKKLGCIQTNAKQIYEQKSKNHNKIQQRESQKTLQKNKPDNYFEKYRRQIKNLQKEKMEIHNKIKNIYFKSSGKVQYLKKKIKNMRVLSDDQLSKMDINGHESKNLGEQRERIDENQKKFGNLTWTYLRPKVRNSKNHKNISKTLHLPILQEEKIENFYENLYKQRRTSNKLRNEGSRLKKKQKERIRQKNEAFEELKTRMIHCNINKNFESFFGQKNIRVPEILKNLR